MEHAGAGASRESGAGVNTHKAPSAPRLLWDGIACVLIGMLLRSLSDETMGRFLEKIYGFWRKEVIE